MTRKKAANPWAEKNQGQLYVVLNCNNDEWVIGTLKEVQARMDEWLEDNPDLDIGDLGAYALGKPLSIEVNTIREAHIVERKKDG